MDIKQLCKYFNREDDTIRKIIKRMCNYVVREYKYSIDGKVIISCKWFELIYKNVFKIIGKEENWIEGEVYKIRLHIWSFL